ncbi:MAG TPA: TadG family pilus assembly protein, partial [Nitrospirota bacterium]
NINYVNAVRVVAARDTIPAASFFAGIFGYAGFSLNAESIAYVGCPGESFPVDQPLAICKESILGSDGNFT